MDDTKSTSLSTGHSLIDWREDAPAFRSMQNPIWHTVQPGSTVSIPPMPGVYIYASDVRAHNLLISRRYLYVGITDNLQRRAYQHAPQHESNLILQQFRLHSRLPTTFLFALDIPEAQRVTLERDLIRTLRPLFNIKHND